MQFAINTAKGWTAIDADGHSPSLCAVSLKTAIRAGERPRILSVAEQRTADGDDERAALRSLMGQVDRSLPLLMILARTSYRLRVMPEPAVPQREMLTSLRWTLSSDSDSDGAGEDFNIAWMRIPTHEQLPSRPVQGYAVMAPTARLNERLSAWRQAGVRPRVVDIRETALRNIAGSLERPNEALAFLSADAEGVSMVFTYQGSLYLDRYIEWPPAEPDAAQGAQHARGYERIALQLHRSIEVIGRNFPFMSIARVVVAPAPECPGLHEFLAAQLPLPVEALDLAQVFDLTQVPALAQSPALQARCLVPLGAALRSAKGAA